MFRMNAFRCPRTLLALCALTGAFPLARAAENGRALFNGRDLTGWDMFMATPDPTWDVPGLKREASGKCLGPMGANRDPLKVFNVEKVDGEPAIHITCQGFGVITTRESFDNFYLRL